MTKFLTSKYSFRELFSSSTKMVLGGYVKVSTDITDDKRERGAAELFSYTPEPITVEKLEADIVDEYNTDIDIYMSNGDIIKYGLSETKKPTKANQTPPFTISSFSINGKELDYDKLLDTYFGSTGTIVGDILLAYKYHLQNKF